MTSSNPADAGVRESVRAPSAYTIERVVSAVQQAMDKLQLEHTEGDAFTDDTDAQFITLDAATLDVHQVMLRLLLAATEAKANAEAVNARMDALSARKARFVRQSDAWREAALQIILALPELFPKGVFKDALVSASVRAGKPGTIITDEAALPDMYVRTKREPDKTAIRDDMLQGVVIPGAELRNPQPFITIRSN